MQDMSERLGSCLITSLAGLTTVFVLARVRCCFEHPGGFFRRCFSAVGYGETPFHRAGGG